MSQNPVALGVDIGGTKVAAGVVDSDGTILFRTEVPMIASRDAETAMNCVQAAIRTALVDNSATGVQAIGVVCPGPMELPEGVVMSPPNLPCWCSFPLGAEVRSRWNLPTVLDNDANAAGLAEALWGVGARYRSIFYVTIGTGIGTAWIVDGRLFCGRTRYAPEGGHMTVDMNAPAHCGCKKRGCVEGLTSGHSIARRARELLADVSQRRTFAWDTDLSAITAKTVVAAWRAGDPLATRVLAQTANVLAVWFGNIIDLIEPDIIVVGGGLGAAMSEWFDTIRKRLGPCSFVPGASETPLVLAAYGSDAGIAGAAALAFSNGSDPLAGCNVTDGQRP